MFVPGYFGLGDGLLAGAIREGREQGGKINAGRTRVPINNGGVFKVLAKDKVRGKEVSMELVENPRLVLASPFGRCQGPPRIG